MSHEPIDDPEPMTETDPFCRHYSSPPADCELKCATCNHLCADHTQDAEGTCCVIGCNCEHWR